MCIHTFYTTSLICCSHHSAHPWVCYVFITVMGTVLTPSIITESLTYTGVRKVEQEVMQWCHRTFSDANSTSFIEVVWHAHLKLKVWLINVHVTHTLNWLLCNKTMQCILTGQYSGGYSPSLYILWTLAYSTVNYGYYKSVCISENIYTASITLAIRKSS